MRSNSDTYSSIAGQTGNISLFRAMENGKNNRLPPESLVENEDVLDKPPFQQMKRLFGQISIVIILLMLYALSLLAFISLKALNKNGFLDGIKNLVRVNSHPDPRAAFDPIVALVIVVGYLLYLLKKRQQIYYGVLEVWFALLNCHLVSLTIRSELSKASDPTYLFLLSGMATLYLLVRGLSNINEGWGKSFLFRKNVYWLYEIYGLNKRPTFNQT